jgi:hypothetical protein
MFKAKKIRIDKNLIIDSAIAGIAVNTIPGLVNKYFLSSNPVTGIALNLVGAGGAYLTGMLLGKNDVANVGIGFAIAETAQSFISSFISGVTATPTSDFQNTPYMGRISDYTNDIQSMPATKYQFAYD